MLNFIGSGSAFNTKLGNNGTFIKEDGVLFMIDCGSSTFNRLLEQNILDGVEHIYVLITHTHADHIGSLGDLILYSYYSMGKMGEINLTVVEPDSDMQDNSIVEILELMGVTTQTYKLEWINNWGEEFFYKNFGIYITATISVNHVSELDCFGYEIEYKDKEIYYSGDCFEIPFRQLDRINNNEYDYVYQDTSGADYEGNVHLSLKKLNEIVKKDKTIRNKIFCMHLDGSFNQEKAEEMGFKVVKNYRGEN